MQEFNLWKKLLKENRDNDIIPKKKYIIIPEQENDKEVASQFEALLNHHLVEEIKEL